jgi:hypothetical protein
LAGETELNRILGSLPLTSTTGIFSCPHHCVSSSQASIPASNTPPASAWVICLRIISSVTTDSFTSRTSSTIPASAACARMPSTMPE